MFVKGRSRREDGMEGCGLGGRWAWEQPRTPMFKDKVKIHLLTFPACLGLWTEPQSPGPGVI